MEYAPAFHRVDGRRTRLHLGNADAERQPPSPHTAGETDNESARRRPDTRQYVAASTGTGKTHLACALGHKACRDDRSVLYHRVPRLLDALALARGDGRYTRLLKSLARVELLILDDWGLAPLTSQQGRDLLEIVDDRHGRGSTIVTSQLPVDHWHEVIVDPTIADAVLDRLVHTAHRLALDGETLRKPPEKSGKHTKLDTDTAE
jgi:DNA replication protein DnaC